MECTGGNNQEFLSKPDINFEDHQQQEAVISEMKHGIGKGGGGDENGETEKSLETSDQLVELNSQELQDLNQTITNENVSDYIMNQKAEKPMLTNSISETDEKNSANFEVVDKEIITNSESSDLENITPYYKIESLDLSSLVSLDELVISENLESSNIDKTGNEGSENSHLEMSSVTFTENLEFKTVEPNVNTIGDGNDSGVETNGCSYRGQETSSAFLRTLSNNSGGYISSCGGMEDSLTASTATPAASCDSSLISCYSTYEDTEDLITSTTTMLIPADGDGTSEGGSESSSVTSKDTKTTRKITSGTCSVKRKTSMTEVVKVGASDRVKTTSPSSTPVNSAKPKSTLNRPSSAGTTKQATTTNTALSKSSAHASQKRDRMSTSLPPSASAVKTASHRSSTSSSSLKSSSSSMSKSLCGSVQSSKVRSKESSASSGSESKKDSISGTTPLSARGRGSRTASSVRNKILGTTDDGRWPSSTSKSHSTTPKSRGSSVIEGQSRKSNVSSSSSVVSSVLMESKATALEKYATLPRRRRCKSPEVQVTIAIDTPLRSQSVSRDPSLNRAASLRKQHHLRDGSSLNKSLPPYPRRRPHARTVIYHETSSQTALTANDVEKALAGVVMKEPFTVAETQEQEVQVDTRVEEVAQLEFQLKLLTEDHTRLKTDSLRQSEELNNKDQLLEEEKAEKLAVRMKLEQHSQRILDMLRNVKGDHLDENDMTDSLQALETYLQTSSNVVIKQQQEINELQTLCRTLKRDLEKSLAAQKTLLQQQQEIEYESIELQEFLQAEKSTLADALKDSEVEISGHRQQLTEKESELERQQEECKHLVRISEQRRQENLALQARLCNLEQRSRELLLQQGAAVSGAAVALSGLSSRLDGLVEQLVVSYNISEKDLEDVIFHNEAYSKSNSSVEASPEKISANRASEQPLFDPQRTPSPKRGASFVSAVITAIRNAAAGGTGKRLGVTIEDQDISQQLQEDNADIVENETEKEMPVDEEIEESCSNPRYSTGSISATCLANSESLQNLTQAILNRQHLELAQVEGSDLTTIEYEGSADLLPPLEDCSPAITLVDQIIDVDNLVTKLLKILRIIQLENDTCMDELHDERMQLAEQVRREQDSRRETQEELRNWERIGARLRGEVQDVRLQLQRRVQELEQTHDELERHRGQIEQLTSELHNLSSVCKQTELQLRSHEEEAENVLQQWQESGELPSPEMLARVLASRDEVPVLKDKLAEKELQLNEVGQKYSMNKQMLTENWHRAATEVRRQYEAIDTALETLHSIQGVVRQCPPLAKLQQELEDTNFQSASSLPLIAADLNANAPPLVTLNGSNGIDTHNKSGNTINGTI